MPQVEDQEQTLCNIRQQKVSYTLHATRSIKLGFVDDTTLFNKSHIGHSEKSSLFHLKHVRHIKPSEVEKEFQYVSRHVVELLNCCHPTLLIKWCENLMASEMHKIKLLHQYSMNKLKKLRTTSAVLKVMSLFWSWSNHSILAFLAQFSEIATNLLKDFDSKLHLNSSIAEYPILPPVSSVIPYNNNSYTILTVKCDNVRLQLSLQQVYDIQSTLIEKCEITEHALQLLAVQSTPLPLLQWMIPKLVVTLIGVKIKCHQEYFATKGITEILIHPNIKHTIDDNVKVEKFAQRKVAT